MALAWRGHVISTETNIPDKSGADLSDVCRSEAKLVVVRLLCLSLTTPPVFAGSQALMQCPAELVYQEVILQPEKMVQWNRTISACQVSPWRDVGPRLSPVLGPVRSSNVCPLLRSSRGSTTTPWCPMTFPQEQREEWCLPGSASRPLHGPLSLTPSLTAFSPLRDFVNVRRVERKRECYMSAGMATNHDSKPPSGRFVRSEHISSLPTKRRWFRSVTFSLCSRPLQGRKRSRRVCGPQVQH